MKRFALLVLLCAGAATAGAQPLTLFAGEGFQGPRFDTGATVEDLDRVGFNDRARSAIVRSGAWQLCVDSSFRGACVTLQPGQYPSLGAMGMADVVSSIREVGGGGSGGNWQGQGGGGGGNWQGQGGWGSGSVVLFESPGLTGRSFTVNGPMPDLGGTGFNDRARSAMINSGTWQLCDDANFMSSCEVLPPGRHDNLGSVTGRVSSLRPFDPNAGGAGRPPGSNWGGGGGNWGGGGRAVLYERDNFRGRNFTMDSDVVANFADVGFNDRASSLRVLSGTWLFCLDANFQGECRTFGPGDYPQLGWFANQISSGRRIDGNFRNPPPRWR